MPPIFESDIEEFVVELLQGQGFDYLASEQQEALDEPAGNPPVGAEKAEKRVFGLNTGIVGLLCS